MFVAVYRNPLMTLKIVPKAASDSEKLFRKPSVTGTRTLGKSTNEREGKPEQKF